MAAELQKSKARKVGCPSLEPELHLLRNVVAHDRAHKEAARYFFWGTIGRAGLAGGAVLRSLSSFLPGDDLPLMHAYLLRGLPARGKCRVTLLVDTRNRHISA